ncbi:MAG: hypothetical protein SFX72_07945 [Isosphaeraceae bacterium]|nr:hypothetical protein [Isosphaeraceae bacterium]
MDLVPAPAPRRRKPAPPVDTATASGEPPAPSPIADEPWVIKRNTEQAKRAALGRKNSGRKHLVDPCTCDPDYSEAEREFIFAVDEYKRTNRRPFPTNAELLRILVGLGYRRSHVDESAFAENRGANSSKPDRAPR